VTTPAHGKNCTEKFAKGATRMKAIIIVLGAFMLSLSALDSSASENRGVARGQWTCLFGLAESIRRHTPASSSLGPGFAEATFRVRPGGRVSSIVASGSTPEHAALARSIFASSRGPKNCGEHLVHQTLTFR
jgi:hypothetical protein